MNLDSRGVLGSENYLFSRRAQFSLSLDPPIQYVRDLSLLTSPSPTSNPE